MQISYIKIGLLLCLTGCAVQTENTIPELGCVLGSDGKCIDSNAKINIKPASQWSEFCDSNTTCAPGLSCLEGTCTFQCGEMWVLQADNTYKYEVNEGSLNDCGALKGECIKLTANYISACEALTE